VASDVRPAKKTTGRSARSPRRAPEAAKRRWRLVSDVVYSARYHVDIGPHVFPTQKYQLVYARLIETGVIRPSDVVEPEPAGWDELGWSIHRNT